MKKKVFKIIGYVLLALFLGFSIGLSFYTYNERVVNNNALPMPFGLGVSVVYSGSMEPTYSPGDLIFVTKPEAYAVDDIIVFQRNEKAVMHRLLSIDGNTIVTKGDANNVADDPMDISVLKGKVVFTIPWVGHIVRLIKTPWGIGIILGIAFLLFEFSFICEKLEQRRKRENLKKEIEELKK